MQIWAESGKSALPICNYSQILYQFLTFTQNLKRSQKVLYASFPFLTINLDIKNCNPLIFQEIAVVLNIYTILHTEVGTHYTFNPTSLRFFSISSY